MSDNCYEQKTLEYYNAVASAYAAETQKLDFSEVRDKFVACLPAGGKILDLGCGAGRDSKAFLSGGFLVTATDGSENLCRIASEYIGQQVVCAKFHEFRPREKYDGIWACASLLHLNKREIESILNRLSAFLNKGGCFYASFKYGDFSGVKDGRFFQYMTEKDVLDILEKNSLLSLKSFLVTFDVREGRQSEKWLNVFLYRV